VTAPLLLCTGSNTRVAEKGCNVRIGGHSLGGRIEVNKGKNVINVRLFSSSSTYAVQSKEAIALQSKDTIHNIKEILKTKEVSPSVSENIVDIIDRDSEVIAKNLYDYIITINNLLPLYSGSPEGGGAEQDNELKIKNKISSIFNKFLHYYKVSGINNKELIKIHDNYRLKFKNIRKGIVNYKYNDELKRDYPYV